MGFFLSLQPQLAFHLVVCPKCESSVKAAEDMANEACPVKIPGVRLHWVLQVHRQAPWRSSKMMWRPHKRFLKFGLLPSYAFGFLILLWSRKYLALLFLLLIGTFMESHYIGQWFLSSGLCSLVRWLFASCLLTWAGCCHPPCHVREAEQMGPLALLVLLDVCLANVNRWRWLPYREETQVPFRFS